MRDSAVVAFPQPVSCGEGRRVAAFRTLLPHSVSGREGAPEELSEAMARRILGFVVVAFPQSVFGREGTPEELSETMFCRILGFLLLPPHNLFPGERVRQRSYLKP